MEVSSLLILILAALAVIWVLTGRAQASKHKSYGKKPLYHEQSIEVGKSDRGCHQKLRPVPGTWEVMTASPSDDSPPAVERPTPLGTAAASALTPADATIDPPPRSKFLPSTNISPLGARSAADQKSVERQMHLICEGWKRGLGFAELRKLVTQFYGPGTKPCQLHWSQIDRLILEIWRQDLRPESERGKARRDQAEVSSESGR